MVEYVVHYSGLFRSLSFKDVSRVKLCRENCYNYANFSRILRFFVEDGLVKVIVGADSFQVLSLTSKGKKVASILVDLHEVIGDKEKEAEVV